VGGVGRNLRGRRVPGVNKGDRLTDESLTCQGVWSRKYSDVALHALRRTYAELAHKGGARLDQIQLSRGNASLLLRSDIWARPPA
jgi:hypothetical protein